MTIIKVEDKVTEKLSDIVRNYFATLRDSPFRQALLPRFEFSANFGLDIVRQKVLTVYPNDEFAQNIAIDTGQ